MPPWRHFTTVTHGAVLRGAAGHLLLEKLLAEGAHQNQETKPFSPLLPVQHALLTKLIIRATGKAIVFKGPGHVFTEQAISMNLHLITGPGKEWFTAQKCGALAIRRGMDSGHAKDFIYTENFKNQGKKKVWEPQRGLGVFTIIQLIPYCWSIAGQVERGRDRVGQRDAGCGVS